VRKPTGIKIQSTDLSMVLTIDLCAAFPYKHRTRIEHHLSHDIPAIPDSAIADHLDDVSVVSRTASRLCPARTQEFGGCNA
jgi:hypothetical protein